MTNPNFNTTKQVISQIDADYARLKEKGKQRAKRMFGDLFKVCAFTLTGTVAGIFISPTQSTTANVLLATTTA